MKLVFCTWLLGNFLDHLPMWGDFIFICRDPWDDWKVTRIFWGAKKEVNILFFQLITVFRNKANTYYLGGKKRDTLGIMCFTDYNLQKKLITDKVSRSCNLFFIINNLSCESRTQFGEHFFINTDDIIMSLVHNFCKLIIFKTG